MVQYIHIILCLLYFGVNAYCRIIEIKVHTS